MYICFQARSESMASVYSGAGEGTRANVTVRGEVQVSLLYNYRLGALEVGVKRCRDLAPVDVKRNRSDPYVKVSHFENVQDVLGLRINGRKLLYNKPTTTGILLSVLTN